MMELRKKYGSLWSDNNALGRLSEKITGLGIDLESINYDNVEQLEGKLTSEDLSCISPPTFGELISRRIPPLPYKALRFLKKKLINQQAEEKGKLTEEQEAYVRTVEDFTQDRESFNAATYRAIFQRN